jgi:HlyD family secretion protein
MSSEHTAAARPRARRRPRAGATWAIVGALTLAALAGCDRAGDRDDGAAAAMSGEVVRAVRVTVVSDGELRATRRASVTLLPARESRVASAATGRVAEVMAREGATVATGDPLVRLDDAALRRALDNAELARDSARVNLDRALRSFDDAVAQAEAAARAAEGSLGLAQRQLEEAEALLRLGAVASSEVQGLRAQRDQAESAAIQARDAVARARRAEQEDIALLELQLAQAEVQVAQAAAALDDAVVRAPFSGEVAEVFVEAGEFVGAGSPVARLLGDGPQLARFSVPPEDAVLIEAMGSVTVVHAGRELPAQVTRVERQAQQARLATVTATLSGEAPRLPSGTVAEVRYEVVLGTGLIVPSGALTADAGRTYVYLVDGAAGAQVARRTEVRVAVESGNQAVVVGVPDDRLTSGAVVVSPRPLDVRDGTPVRVVQSEGGGDPP